MGNRLLFIDVNPETRVPLPAAEIKSLYFIYFLCSLEILPDFLLLSSEILITSSNSGVETSYAV